MITNMNKRIIPALIIIILLSGIIFSYKTSVEFSNNNVESSDIIALNTEVQLLDRNDSTQASNYEAVADNFCVDAQKTLQFLGYILAFVKILVPLAIIVVGSFDYYKAVTTGSSDDLKKQSITLIKRVISGLIIFFIPTILNLIFHTVNGFAEVEADYNKCADCLFTPTKCITD